jgi:hypothetical protein
MLKNNSDIFYPLSHTIFTSTQPTLIGIMMSLAVPSLPAYYAFIDDALKALNCFAATEGYVIVKRRLYSYKNVIKRIDLKCDKSGKL